MKTSTVEWGEDISLRVEVVCKAEAYPPEDVTVKSVILHKGDLEIDILSVLPDKVIEQLRVKAFAEE
jgi:hypothetical protein